MALHETLQIVDPKVAVEVLQEIKVPVVRADIFLLAAGIPEPKIDQSPLSKWRYVSDCLAQSPVVLPFTATIIDSHGPDGSLTWENKPLFGVSWSDLDNVNVSGARRHIVEAHLGKNGFDRFIGEELARLTKDDQWVLDRFNLVFNLSCKQWNDEMPKEYASEASILFARQPQSLRFTDGSKQLISGLHAVTTDNCPTNVQEGVLNELDRFVQKYTVAA